AACGAKGQSLERDDRALDGITPRSRGTAPGRPSAPKCLNLTEGILRVDRMGPRKVGQPIAHDKWDCLTGNNVKFADGLQILTAERHRGTDNNSLRSADRGYPAFRQPLDPRHDGAVVEAQDELGADLHPPAKPSDQPHKVGNTVALGDEIDEF